jgi:hypothetical protein
MSAKIGDDEFVCIRDTRKVITGDDPWAHLSGDSTAQCYKRKTKTNYWNTDTAPYLTTIRINQFFNTPKFEDEHQATVKCYSSSKEISTEYPDCGELLMERTISSFVPQQAFMSVAEARTQLAAKKAAADAQRAAERQAQHDAFNASRAAERPASQARIDAEPTRQEEADSAALNTQTEEDRQAALAGAQVGPKELGIKAVPALATEPKPKDKAPLTTQRAQEQTNRDKAETARKKEEQRKADEKRLAAEKQAEQEEAEQQAKSWSNNKFTHPYTLIAAGLGISSLAFIKYYWNECAQYQADKEAAIHPEKFPSFSTYFLNRLATTFNVSKAVFVSAAVVAGYGFYKNLNG